MIDYKNLDKKIEEILRERDIGDANPTPQLHEFSEDSIEDLCGSNLGPVANKWNLFTRSFGHFRPREFTVFCGTSGAGKTSFLANLSSQFVTNTIPHFVASVETGASDYLIRLVSCLEGFDFNTGDQFEKERIKKLFAKWKPVLSKRNLFVSPYTNKVSSRRLLCDLLHANKVHGCKVAFIDNLNFIMPIVNQNDSNMTMDKVIHDFIIFCKNIDMHIVMVMHPRKKEDDQGCARVESEYDIKGSSTVVQEAHNVILLNRPTKKQEEDGYNRQMCREIKLAKLRRRGRYTGTKIMFRCTDCRYNELEVEEKQ